MLILFFDTYIVAGTGQKGGFNKSSFVESELSKFRDVFPTYKWQEKIDVVKYTLLSYSVLDWDKVIIRYECEDESLTEDFQSFCRSAYPDAIIQNERSDTSLKYLKALESIEFDKDPWIFFSPNNDHPYINKNDLLKKFIRIADEVVDKYPNLDVSINYSHFSESNNDNGFMSPQYGYYMDVYKKILYENNDVFVSCADNLTNDSIRIYKLSFLIEIFKTCKNNGRVIRIEDTEHYVSKRKSIVISPKVELCRHYDSYTHILKRVPPLFIPPGFWDGNVKIRYGYDDYVEGYVNINPLKEFVSHENDCMFSILDIPLFWTSKISHISVNEKFSEPEFSEISYYKYLMNPWKDNLVIFNIARSFLITTKSRLKKSKTFSLLKFRRYN